MDVLSGTFIYPIVGFIGAPDREDNLGAPEIENNLFFEIQ